MTNARTPSILPHWKKVPALGSTRAAVLTAAARATQGWDFADALHHALSHGCEDFSTLDADLVKRAARATASGAKVTPMITKL